MVVNTKPGTTVPLTIYRDNQRKSLNITIDELDLEAEQGRAGARSEPNRTSAADGDRLRHDVDAITPDMARRLDLPRGQGGAIVTDVDRNSPAANAGIAPDDVILEGQPAEGHDVSQVTRELQRAASGRHGVPASCGGQAARSSSR